MKDDDYKDPRKEGKRLAEEGHDRDPSSIIREEVGRNHILSKTLGLALDAVDCLSNILADLQDGEIKVKDLKKNKKVQENWTACCQFWHSGTSVLRRHGRSE